jgi:hypothetical protein
VLSSESQSLPVRSRLQLGWISESPLSARQSVWATFGVRSVWYGSRPKYQTGGKRPIGQIEYEIVDGYVSPELRPQLSLVGLSATSNFASQRHGACHHANTCGSPRSITGNSSLFGRRSLSRVYPATTNPWRSAGTSQNTLKGPALDKLDESSAGSQIEIWRLLHRIFEVIAAIAAVATIVYVAAQLI